MARIPSLPKINVDKIPTLPLDAAELDRLLAQVDKTFPDTEGPILKAQRERIRKRVRALFLLMRYSGLALGDATSLPRKDMTYDARGFYRIVTARQKTGTDVSVIIPRWVGETLEETPNENREFFFWTGNSKGDNHATKWQTRYIAPVFKAAGLYGGGHMVSHRLRDTFAVDLLEKGVPLEEVSKLLGHESIKTTEKHYAKWVKGRQDRADELVMAAWATTQPSRNQTRRRATPVPAPASPQ